MGKRVGFTARHHSFHEEIFFSFCLFLIPPFLKRYQLYKENRHLLNYQRDLGACHNKSTMSQYLSVLPLSTPHTTFGSSCYCKTGRWNSKVSDTIIKHSTTTSHSSIFSSVTAQEMSFVGHLIQTYYPPN